MSQLVLALDQGTTSSRAIVFSADAKILSQAQQEFPQLLPAPAVVEHDPESIWSSQLAVAQRAIADHRISPDDVAALGITNRRETTILWERTTGRPVANAVVWQSRISAPICDRLKADGIEPLFRERTGLVLDPYFSGTKIRHLLDTLPGLQQRAERGEILFGTIDSFLIWRLTSGRCHVTDVSNASRTLLFNIHACRWDDELLRVLNIPRCMLPQVVPSSHVIGECDARWLGKPILIAGCAGDQQAATFGQACFQPGEAKNTYGTGCFLLMNTGEHPVTSQNKLLTTIGWQIGDRVTYCLEGAVFIGGAVVQWLRDGLALIQGSQDVESLAAGVPNTAGVYFVPAFVGLGAPYWDPNARGTIVGITRGTTAAHLARAALESIAFQTCDLIDALRRDARTPIESLQVDGGASRNDLLMQIQADLLGVPIRRSRIAETTALGAAFLAGLAVGVWPDLTAIRSIGSLDREFRTTILSDERAAQLDRWRAAVALCRQWTS
jgi:glycerol kinase